MDDEEHLGMKFTEVLAVQQALEALKLSERAWNRLASVLGSTPALVLGIPNYTELAEVCRQANKRLEETK